MNIIHAKNQVASDELISILKDVDYKKIHNKLGDESRVKSIIDFKLVSKVKELVKALNGGDGFGIKGASRMFDILGGTSCERDKFNESLKTVKDARLGTVGCGLWTSICGVAARV